VGEEGHYSEGEGVFSRAHAKAIISRTGRSCLRYYRFRRVYSMYIYRRSQGIRTRARTYTHVYIQYRPVANNYSGQLDIPRAYKHARARTRARRFHPYLPTRSIPPVFRRSDLWLRDDALARSPIAREIRRAILEHPRRQHIQQRIRSSRIGYKFLTIKFDN